MSYIKSRRIVSILLIFFMTIACINITAVPAHAATVLTIPSTSTIVSDSYKLKLNQSNCKITWNTSTSHKTVTLDNGNSFFCVKIKDETKGWSLSNFAKLTFTNVCTVQGRQLDCTINFDSLTVSKRQANSSSEEGDGYMAFAAVYKSSNGVRFSSSVSMNHGYMAVKEIIHTINIYYHDTGETVDLPFFQVVSDINAGNSWYSEGWQSISGYTGKYYKYSTNVNRISGNEVLAPSGGIDVTGTEKITKTGIYAPTTNGNFKAVFLEGNCATILNLYSQYSEDPGLFTSPTKVVDKTEAKPGETVSYSVIHKMGTFYQDTMTVYGKFEISDTIPANLRYVSATVTNGSGTNITSSGTLSYNSSTRKLTFVMGSSWLNTIANYNGQKITLTIKAEVEDFDGWSYSASNTASVSLESSLTVSTNTVKTTLVKPPAIRIVKKVPAGTDVDEHGKITSLFKITGDSTGRTWYRSVTFDDEDASKGWSFSEADGFMIATSEIIDLPVGETCTVSEVNVSRLRQTSLSTFRDGNFMEFTFFNKKLNYGYFSHNSILINRLVEGGAEDEE